MVVTSEDYDDQKEVLQQIQKLLNKQTEAMKTLQYSMQPPKVASSPLASSPFGYMKSYWDVAPEVNSGGSYVWNRVRRSLTQGNKLAVREN